MKKYIIIISLLLLKLNGYSESNNLMPVDSFICTEKYNNDVCSDINRLTKLQTDGYIGKRNFTAFHQIKIEKKKDYTAIYATARCENFYSKDGDIYSQNYKSGIIYIKIKQGYSKYYKEYMYFCSAKWLEAQEIKALNKDILNTFETTSLEIEPLLKETTTDKARKYFLEDKMLEDYCFVKRIYFKDKKPFIDIDFIQVFHGDEAFEKAKEDSIDLSFDRHIRNQSKIIRTYSISEDAVFILQYPQDTVDIVGVLKKMEEHKYYKDYFFSSVKIKNKQLFHLYEVYSP